MRILEQMKHRSRDFLEVQKKTHQILAAPEGLHYLMYMNSQSAALKTHEPDLRGLEVVPAPVRYYPFGELGAQMIGYYASDSARSGKANNSAAAQAASTNRFGMTILP